MKTTITIEYTLVNSETDEECEVIVSGTYLPSSAGSYWDPPESAEFWLRSVKDLKTGESLEFDVLSNFDLDRLLEMASDEYYAREEDAYEALSARERRLNLDE